MVEFIGKNLNSLVRGNYEKANYGDHVDNAGECLGGMQIDGIY